MNVREYVDDLFAKYRDSADMTDFKEEVCVNLQERINYLEKKGATQEEAFVKATVELGDISEIADQICKDKRKEVIETMYMRTRSYMDNWHIIGYTAAGGLFVLGIILTLCAYFVTGDPKVGFASLIPFFIAPVCAFVFLGLTQETARNYPMDWRRAIIYTVSAGAVLFGLIVFTIMYFENDEMYTAIGALMPFVVPGATCLTYLLLTEKSRNKPWVIEQEVMWAERMGKHLVNPHMSVKFVLYSGAMWILAVALFITIGFIIGFQYSWLIFLIALAGQLLVQALMMPKE